MVDETQKSGIWNQLSISFLGAIQAVQDSVVAIHGGGRSTSSGVVWRPGIAITTHHGLRHREGIKVNHAADSLDASLIGSDPATDLAVLRISSENLRPVRTTTDKNSLSVVPNIRMADSLTGPGVRSMTTDPTAFKASAAGPNSAESSCMTPRATATAATPLSIRVARAGSGMPSNYRDLPLPS